MTEQKYEQLVKDFFSGGEKGWTSQGKYYRNKKKMLAKQRTKAFLPDLYTKARAKHPELEVSASGWRQVQSPSQSSRWSAISSYSVDSQMNSRRHHPFSAQEEKQFFQKHITCHLSHAWLFPSPTPPLPLNCFQMMPIFLLRQRAFGYQYFPPAE